MKGFAIVLLLFVCRVAFAQPVSFNYSVNPQYGLYFSHQSDFGYVAGVELNASVNKVLYSLDYLYFKEADFLFWGPEPRERYNQIGCYAGTYFGEKYFRFQLQGGLSAIWGYDRTDVYLDGGSDFGGGKYQAEKFVEIGMPFKLGFKLIPVYFLSIGIDVKAGLTLHRQLIYPMISMEIGRLRNKITRGKN